MVKKNVSVGAPPAQMAGNKRPQPKQISAEEFKKLVQKQMKGG